MVTTNIELPGLDCGLCGYRTCDEFRGHLAVVAGVDPPVHSSFGEQHPAGDAGKADGPHCRSPTAAAVCRRARRRAADARRRTATRPRGQPSGQAPWHDSLGRDFDFYLEHFPEDPGPREIIIPHNPAITREIDVQVGDILIGRPLGMSCGCPITHCGVATQVDMRTGVIVWCVTGPLGPRAEGFQGPRLLHRRRLRGPGERNPRGIEGRACGTSSSRRCACCSGVTAGC